jgi:hypothetical protein
LHTALDAAHLLDATCSTLQARKLVHDDCTGLQLLQAAKPLDSNPNARRSSSAFCLGAMQALHGRGVIDKVDYLSTVSGGGYIGTSMTAAMSTGAAGNFPFTRELREGEMPGVQHIRDHSNYLFPQGFLNLFGNIVVYLRGLIANVMLLLPWLLLGSAFTIWSNPNVEALTRTNVAGHQIHLPISVRFFGLTLNVFLAFVICCGNLRRMDALTLHLRMDGVDDQAWLTGRTVGGSATPDAESARLAAGRSRKHLSSCSTLVSVSESRSARMSGQEPLRPRSAMRSSNSFFRTRARKLQDT